MSSSRAAAWLGAWRAPAFHPLPLCCPTGLQPGKAVWRCCHVCTRFLLFQLTGSCLSLSLEYVSQFETQHLSFSRTWNVLLSQWLQLLSGLNISKILGQSLLSKHLQKAFKNESVSGYSFPLFSQIYSQYIMQVFWWEYRNILKHCISLKCENLRSSLFQDKAWV